MTNTDNSAGFSDWNVYKWVFICSVIGFAVVSPFANLIEYRAYKESVQLHQEIQQQGVKTTATAYYVKCKGMHKSTKNKATGYYRYQANNKTYEISDYQITSREKPCGIKIGDTLSVYYLPDKPSRNLKEDQLKQGVPNEFHINFLMKYSWGLVLIYVIFKLFSYLYKKAKKTS